LPDGIVDSSATHILEEFKATESLNEDAFQKVLGYYRDNHNLKRDQVQTFIVTAVHPGRRPYLQYALWCPSGNFINWANKFILTLSDFQPNLSWSANV